jgi:hypothetical protein
MTRIGSAIVLSVLSRALPHATIVNTNNAAAMGGAVGTNEPAVYQLSGPAISGHAKSPANVLGPVDFDFTTKFNSSGMIGIFFPVKVSKAGFWLNPSLGNVEPLAADTNFAFSGINETILEMANPVSAGNFAGIRRAAADFGGFKIIALGATGFTVDDFTFAAGSSSAVPEPATLLLLGCGLVIVSRLRFRRTKLHDEDGQRPD